MAEDIKRLQRARTGMLLLNLAYFAALLAAGVLVFLKDMGGAVYVLVAACVAVYLLVVRPSKQRYLAAVRAVILERTVCAQLEEVRYQPKEGVSRELALASGLVPSSRKRAFISREHITGRCGTISVELADVGYPILEDSRNAMFNGVFLRLTWPDADFPPVTVRAGETAAAKLPRRQQELLEELGSLIPGSLYLRAEGDTLDVLLRGRFLGFPVNPLMAVNERTLGINMFPELEQTIRLARLLRLQQGAS